MAPDILYDTRITPGCTAENDFNGKATEPFPLSGTVYGNAEVKGAA